MLNTLTIDELKSLVGLNLTPLSQKERAFMITEIDNDNNKILIKTFNRESVTTRNLKFFEIFFDEIKSKNYCCIEDSIKLDGMVLSQIQTIAANLAKIYFFHYNKKTFLFYVPESYKAPGTIEELNQVDQPKAKRVINSSKRLDYIELAYQVEKNIRNFKKEIDNLHALSPGILSNTNIKTVTDDFDKILTEIEATKFSSNKKNNIYNLDNFDINAVEMSDIIDIPQITGIDSGEDSYHINTDEENSEAKFSLKVPNIRRQTPSLALLYDRLLYDEIEIQPEYQRKDRIWSDDKKSKLIESILMQLPLPIFYFGEREDDVWVVIDGLQRITTVQDFMRNKFPLKLEKSSSVYEMNGLTFQEFSRSYTRILREFEITAYVIELQESDDSNRFIIELFHRINTYGVKLSDQEIRSAINFGSSVFYLRYLATSSLFLNATTYTINDKRQKDLELCLGALSFILFGYSNFNYNRYDSFLSSTMKWINKQTFKKVENDDDITYHSDSQEITELTRRFEKGLRVSMEIFGRDAFKKQQNSTKKDPISKPLFELFVTIFSNIDDANLLKLRENKDIFINKLYDAIADDSTDYAKWNSPSYENTNRGLNYSLSSSTGKRTTILYRFESILQILLVSTGCAINIQPMLGDQNA
ncbi:DUF262 domain-containing protein [Pantoea sp. SGAir0175]